MNNLGNFNLSNTNNTLTDLQVANIKGIFHQDPMAYIIFVVFVFLIILYIFYIKKMYK